MKARTKYLALTCCALLALTVSNAVGEEAGAVSKSAGLRVAAISFVPAKFDLAGNADRLERAFREAKAGGARLAVAPEGSLEGYVVNEIIAGEAPAERMREVAIPIDDAVIRRFQKLAKELEMCLVFGFAERIEEDVFNCAIFIDHEGTIRGKQYKMQLAEGYHPSWWFNRLGAHNRAFDTPIGRCGILICNDRWNPDLARIPVLDGARLLLIPAMGSRSKRNDETVLARGRENGVPVIEANVGVTLIVDQGEIVAVDRNEEGITYADITVPPPVSASPEKRDAQERRFLDWRKNEMKRRYAKTMRKVRRGAEIRVVDKEVRYGTKVVAEGDKPRPAPEIDVEHLAITPLPVRIKSPGGWEENVYSASGEQTTLRASGKEWIVHLVETTRGVDDTAAGAQDYKVWYRVSRDMGKSYSELKPLIQKGEKYNYLHPMEGVYVGKNGFVFGGRILSASNGEILVPTYRWPLDAEGKPLNPHGAYTYMESGVLIGRWREDGSDIDWESGEFVRPEANESTRGSDECAIAEMSTPGHFIMIARGSNQNRVDFPGRKWYAESKDYCRTWTKPVPWRFDDGEVFYSPAALSSLIRSRKNGKLYWIGNITPENPDGNYPRFPLVIGEVDEESHLLKRETILTIDTRNPEHDSTKMQLSNFRTVEDLTTGRLLVSLTRMDDEKLPATNDPKTWYQGPANWYLIELP